MFSNKHNKAKVSRDDYGVIVVGPTPTVDGLSHLCLLGGNNLVNVVRNATSHVPGSFKNRSKCVFSSLTTFQPSSPVFKSPTPRHPY